MKNSPLQFLLVLLIFQFSTIYAQGPYLVGYWHNWNDSNAPYFALDQVDSRYNVINLSFAIPGNGTDYDMIFTPCCGETQAGLIARIQSLQAAGVKVNISIGGATAPIHLDNTTEKNSFVSSMNNIINTYGFDGLDIDLEGASLSVSASSTISNPTDANITNFIGAIQEIMTAYQSNFGKKMFLSAAPETAFVQGGQSNWGGIWGAYLPVLDALRNDMDLLHVQLYNSGSMYGIDGGIYNQATADFIVSQTEAVIAGFSVNAGGFFNGYPASKVAIGLPACPSAAGGGFTPPNIVKQALDYLMGNGPQPGNYTLSAGPYPDLGGMMTWSLNWDAISSCNAGIYEFASNFETIFQTNSCLDVNLGADISACGLSFPYTLNSNTPTANNVLFSWNNLSNNQSIVSNSPSANTIQISAPGIYQVIRDSAGCQHNDIIQILDDLEIPDLSTTMNLCNTLPESISIANVNAFPTGTTWTWYKDNVLLDMEQTASLNDIRSAGEYTLLATYLNCTSSGAISVTSSLPEPVDNCGIAGSSLDLSIVPNTFGIFNWYDAANGGNLLHTGTSFTTPSLSNSTIYYVEDGSAVGNATTGPAAINNNLGSTGNWLQSTLLRFDANNNFTLKGFTIYPLIWCYSHTITIEIRDANGTILPNGSQSFTIDDGTNCNDLSGPVAVTLSGGGVSIPQGLAYEIVSTGSTSLNHWSGPVSYPMDYSPYFTITGGDFNDYYLAVHDWVVEGASCARLPVHAIIDSACGSGCMEDHMMIDQSPIAGGNYQAILSINSSGNIPVGADVNFKAGELIELNSGFCAEANFSADIEGCN